jgi:hypothetical protein
MFRLCVLLTVSLILTACSNLHSISPHVQTWKTLETINLPTARHEASMAEAQGKLYLLGGRRINPIDVFDPKTAKWTQLTSLPIELHHFQAITVDNVIYILGAFTGQWPNETPVDRVIKYYPEQDKFEYGHTIPDARRRGAAGAVYHNGKIYLVGGITDGHMGGYRPWLDAYDPKTSEWQILADAPNARDHFQATVVDNKLYAIAGRHSSQATNQGFELTVAEVDVFDFATQQWSSLPTSANLPTQRAGNMAITWQDKVIVVGGESGSQIAAHNEVEVFDVKTQQWNSWADLNEGRHGSGLVILDNALYTASGCANRGGEPELFTIETLPLDSNMQSKPIAQTVKKWHTITLSFKGPQVSETDQTNPFTDYRLMVEFRHGETTYNIRGFYAADGAAADSGADSGNLWQVRFTPEKTGSWEYQAHLRKGNDVALSQVIEIGETVDLTQSTGSFEVVESDVSGRDFRGQGRLKVDNGYFRFDPSGHYWLKGGANSPENFLAYYEFDNTYRMSAQSRAGEANADDEIHRFAAHRNDWKVGDPTWRGGKGKNLLGAINYLADVGMNSIYFLTLNIEGDGKDVWPYINPTDHSRFDVSKLEQWEIVFSHMQQKGILLHIVTQETENERMLDDGNVGRNRQLYYQELIARFGHHLALVWNLGEENGPTDWSPVGQNDEQRIGMANFFEGADPYQHPVLLHTHSTAHEKDEILTPLLGLNSLDGLSFQVDERDRVYSELALWRQRANSSGKPWLITMDEIGQWHTGALNDKQDPDHNSLRRHVLWGSLLAGAAGVEWYFGGQQPHNDLTAEDWRTRDNLWKQTYVAMTFFNRYIDFWSLVATPTLVNNADVTIATNPQSQMVLYFPAQQTTRLDLRGYSDDFSLAWFDPKNGGELVYSMEKRLTAGEVHLLSPPKAKNRNQDWVALILPAITNKDHQSKNATN